jgi:hypothetical protein
LRVPAAGCIRDTDRPPPTPLAGAVDPREGCATADRAARTGHPGRARSRRLSCLRAKQPPPRRRWRASRTAHEDLVKRVVGGRWGLAYLGLAQLDERGKLNVSRLGPRLTGAGGFITTTQYAKKVLFLGTFTANDFEVEDRDGKLAIVQEGKVRTYAKLVERMTFSGGCAAEVGQPVLCVTERAAFKLAGLGYRACRDLPRR